MEDIAGLGHTEVRRGIVHFDAIGRCYGLVCHSLSSFHGHRRFPFKPS